MLALLLVDLFPQFILFVGRVLVAPDPVAGLGHEIDAGPAVRDPGAADRRAARRDRGADRGLDAAPRLRDGRDHRDRRSSRRSSSPWSGPLDGGDIGRLLVLLSPGDILDGANAWIFGSISENAVVAAIALPGRALRRRRPPSARWRRPS